MGNVWEWLFTPLARFSNLVELNDWLAIRCRELAQRKHPCHSGRTINECFQEEQRLLRPIIAPFEGYVEQMMRVSNTSLVHVDRNRYSVPVRFARQAVSVHISANPIQVVAQAQVVATHQRVFGRDQLICNPWALFACAREETRCLTQWCAFR
ncbi:Transposase [Mycoavidus cysteinexigens]|uniref:Transposase n=1 Tax=Mycoavidus cysteinexigens TaxID=1553431 RepID=A0A2Z6EV96_9BURK|nr:hypothetical protein [Mycoavidus cysteinexigens]BBE09390.1 Transposase [Mycoavidus cysteinexigens]GLR01022.1 hypothetical protein GCM10007934_08340 [Mycoavidus cysteinexigens]